MQNDVEGIAQASNSEVVRAQPNDLRICRKERNDKVRHQKGGQKEQEQNQNARKEGHTDGSVKIFQVPVAPILGKINLRTRRDAEHGNHKNMKILVADAH